MQDALTTWLHDQEHDIHDVRDFFPAYQVKQEKEQLRYTPEWRVQLSDGQVLPFTYTEKDEPPETSDPADQASEPEEEA